MVARTWDWSLAYMATHFGWKAALAILVSNLTYFLVFRKELQALETAAAVTTIDDGDKLPKTPWAITAVHLAFLAFVVTQAHYPALFIGAFLFFLGFAQATSHYQSAIDLKPPLLVGFFLGGLVTHGGLQGWWIGPMLNGLSEQPLFWSATVLTAFNDNALITYLATLVPDLSDDAEVRRRRRRRHRRRPHRDRQRPEPGGAGDPRQVLPERRVAPVAGGLGSRADADRGGVLPHLLTPQFTCLEWSISSHSRELCRFRVDR